MKIRISVFPDLMKTRHPVWALSAVLRASSLRLLIPRQAYTSLNKTRKTVPAGSKTGRRELTAKTSSETKRETKKFENEETVLQSTAPERDPPRLSAHFFTG